MFSSEISTKPSEVLAILSKLYLFSSCLGSKFETSIKGFSSLLESLISFRVSSIDFNLTIDLDYDLRFDWIRFFFATLFIIFAGKLNVKVVPMFLALSIVRLPCRFSAICLQILRPKP